jgi:hypothetical protein
VDIWAPRTGVQRAFCESELAPAHHLHFAKLLWSVDQRRALLDTGTVFTSDGAVIDRTAIGADDLRLRVQWEPSVK